MMRLEHTRQQLLTQFTRWSKKVSQFTAAVK